MPLFQSKKHRLYLTDAGRIYVNDAQMILHVQEELEKDLKNMLEAEKSSLDLFLGYALFQDTA